MTIKNQINKDPRIITATDQNIIKAANALVENSLVAFPTETVYGLGADATSEEAVEKIFRAKGRPDFNPLIVHVFSRKCAHTLAHFSPLADSIASAFWPGPLTMILKKRSNTRISAAVSARLDTLAIRIPNHVISQKMLKIANIPIAAPSANLSGTVSPTMASHVLDAWPNPEILGPKFILDGGDCQIGVESTVLDLTTSTPIILRPGGITQEKLETKLDNLYSLTNNYSVPRSPGMLHKHYSPKTSLILNADAPLPNGAYVAFGKDQNGSKYNLSFTGSLDEAASNLFSIIRHLDKKNYATISIAPIPKNGLGIAINDRLERAAR